MLVDWTAEFDQWFDRVEAEGGHLLAVVVAMLQALADLPAPPVQESATFQRVRPARRHELWRVAHPYDPESAVRLICWFPSSEAVVVALCYAGATARGEALVDQWQRQQGDDRD